MASAVKTRVKLSSKNAKVSVEQVLAMVASGDISPQDAAQAIAEAQAGKRGYEIGQSEKGAICVYGFSAKWPISLYPEQWIAMRGLMDEICDFAIKHPITDAHKLAQQLAKAAAKASK